MSEATEETGPPAVWTGKPGQAIEQPAAAPTPIAPTPIQSSPADAHSIEQAEPIPPPADGYAVYLFPAAVDALGGIVKPYLQHEGGEPRLLCREVDTGGALIELPVVMPDDQGGEIEVELMLPTNMVRMIVTTKHDGRFGFGRKTEVGLL